MSPKTLTLNDVEAADPTVAGSKAAGLARLHQGGFSVPDARVLPIGVGDDDADTIAPWARDAVKRACVDLNGPLAVRSSASWEDGATSAHAGATTTVLDVSGTDATVAAVQRCVRDTRAAQVEHGAEGDVAVILQQLVPAEWAGVAFTADPVTGERDVVRIAATEGLGEALVQGEVVGLDLTVRGDRIDGERGGLPADVVRAIADEARKVEAAFGRPQDIEWAVAAGELHLLQARPITVLPVEPPALEGNNWQKDIAHYPEPITPFGFSLLEACHPSMASVFKERGLIVLGAEERSVGGEIYSRIVPAIGSADDAGDPPPAFALGIAARVVPALRRQNRTARRALEEGQGERWVADWHDHVRAEMLAENERLGALDLSRLSDGELAEHVDELIDHVQRGMQVHFRLFMPYLSALHDLHRVVGDALGWADAEIAPMLAGHSPATRASEDAMADLRRRIAATPGAAEALADRPTAPVEVLRALDADLADAVQAWIDRHGWAMVNYDAGRATLAERPRMVTRLLLSEPDPPDFAAADETVDRARAALPVDRVEAFDDAIARARVMHPLREDNTIIVGDGPLSLLRRWMLEVSDRLVARGALPSREDAVYLTATELRDQLAGTADGSADAVDLVSRRRGEEAWVRANPGPAYLGERGGEPDISRLPKALRAVNEPLLWAAGHEFPEPTELSDDTNALVAGIAVSPGTAEGPVRVIRSHEEMGKLEEGDVLVCQVTSPSWAPLFPLAAAVVADGGGVLSHAAIASREHGLPAVLGTGSATTDLVDGQRVRVDGTRGLVLSVD